MQHQAVDGSLSRPDMKSLLEYFRAADEIAGVPIRERDLAARRRRVENLYSSGLDQVDAVLRTALAEQPRAAVQHLALARTHHLRDFGFGQSLEQIRRPT